MPCRAALDVQCGARQRRNHPSPRRSPNLQAAIDTAVSGDVIDVASGTYRLPPIPGAGYSVLLNKNITLVARELYQAILDGGGADTVLVRIQGAATVEGFILQNATTALQQRQSPISTSNSI